MHTIVMVILQFVKNKARILSACALALLGIFIAISLWQFNLYDASPFYFDSQRQSVSNAAGTSGAWLAGLLYYLFGSAAWLCVLLCFFISYALVQKKAWRNQWERFVAHAVGIIFSSLLLQVHRVDMPGIIPGGYVGLHVSHLLLRRLDPFGLRIFIYAMLFSCVIVLLRFSWMPLVHYVMKAARFCASQRCMQPARRVLATLAYGVTYPFRWMYRTAQHVCATKTIHSKERSILEFERGIKQTSLQDDTFWQKYVQEGPKVQEHTVSESQTEMQTHGKDAIDNAPHEMQEPLAPYEKYGQQPQQEKQEPNISKAQVTESFFSHQEQGASHEHPDDKPSYSLPSLDVFIGNQEERDDPKVMEYLQERAEILQEKLQRFGVSGTVVSIKRGPVVTLFEYQPDIDCKISKITSLEDDLALALQALSIRIIAPIPGKPLVGFEVSNKHRRSVYFADVVKSSSFTSFDGALPLVLGQDTVGNNVTVDLARMPHLLIAGSTGSGKSVALNAMLISLLCRLSPDRLRLVLIDPKRLEFASYADIAHLLFPIITHPKKAAPVLKWVVQEMEDRYEKMATQGARNIHDYNVLIEKEGNEQLPYIVVVIDELADLMMTAGREIEDLIARITQMARAAGIHLIVATQRPSVDVITGLIKVNFPSRMSFRVTSKIDSRTILDCSGADKLLGRGDMLFLDAHGAGLQRLHGAYVSDKEIDKVVNHIRSQRQVDYLDLNEQIEQIALDEDRDEIYTDVLGYLEEVDEVSISLLQRKFKIGYNRSARIIDMLEAEGFITPAGGGKTRSVIR